MDMTGAAKSSRVVYSSTIRLPEAEGTVCREPVACGGDIEMAASIGDVDRSYRSYISVKGGSSCDNEAASSAFSAISAVAPSRGVVDANRSLQADADTDGPRIADTSGTNRDATIADINPRDYTDDANCGLQSASICYRYIPCCMCQRSHRIGQRVKFVNVTRQVEYSSAVIGGCLLSVNAGYLNAITFLEAGFSCSNMTGNAVRVGSSLETGAFADSGRFIALMLAFTLGSALTGLLGGNYDNFHLGHSYGRVFCLCFAVLLLALFAERFSRYRIVYVTLCCVACGLQNAMTTKFSGNMIRTTHVTGSLTDIGIALGRMWRGRHDQAWKLGLLVPLVLCYMLGSFLGAFAFQRLDHGSLLVNVILFGLTALLYSIYFSKYFKVRFWEALVGVYDFAEEGNGQLQVGVADCEEEKSDFDIESNDSNILGGDYSSCISSDGLGTGNRTPSSVIHIDPEVIYTDPNDYMSTLPQLNGGEGGVSGF